MNVPIHSESLGGGFGGSLLGGVGRFVIFAVKIHKSSLDCVPGMYARTYDMVT